MMLGTLGTSQLGNILAGKEVIRAGSGRRSLNAFKKGQGIVRTGYGKEWNF